MYLDAVEITTMDQKDDTLKKKWLNSIPRGNFVPNKHSKVCELHFSEDNVIWKISEQDLQTGRKIEVNLQRPRLKENAVPTIFPNCPKYLSKNAPTRKSKDQKLKELDEQRLLQAIKESKEMYSRHKEATSFQNFDEFLNIFKTINLQNS